VGAVAIAAYSDVPRHAVADPDARYFGTTLTNAVFILVVVVVVPLVALTVLVGLIAAVVATPYVIVLHIRGHRAGHEVFRRRLGRALDALVDIAPNRLLAAVRRGHAAR
jgi:Flp pilus assembly protein TadB